MKDILIRHNLALKQQVGILLETTEGKDAPHELELYKQWLLSFLGQVNTRIDKNLRKLEKNVASILPDILSYTEEVSQQVRLLSTYYIPPIHRSIHSDKIALKLLKWLHERHDKSVSIPFAISDGAFGIYPTVPTLYYLPATDQKGLLYLPLFFHEFGHLLFKLHKPEMDDLVREIQLGIEEFNRPTYVHNDDRSAEEFKNVEAIVNTWYKWVQEFFCDAVGLVIGGESYLYAFSGYCQMGGRDEFHQRKEDLNGRTHPVTLIRVHLLVKRARKLGYHDAADRVENEWRQLQRQYIRTPEYFGYYADEYEPIVEENLDYMLEEASPYLFDASEDSPVHVLNDAWGEFLERPQKFSEWEREAIRTYLG